MTYLEADQFVEILERRQDSKSHARRKARSASPYVSRMVCTIAMHTFTALSRPRKVVAMTNLALGPPLTLEGAEVPLPLSAPAG